MPSRSRTRQRAVIEGSQGAMAKVVVRSWIRTKARNGQGRRAPGRRSCPVRVNGLSCDEFQLMRHKRSKEKPRLRRATSEDAPALARLMVDAWQAAYRELVPDSYLSRLSAGRWEARFRESLAAGTEETYAVEAMGAVVGLLTLGACRDLDEDQEATGEIWGIYIAPSHWRRGIGSWVYSEGERMLRERGYGQVVLWVFERNAQARRFYESSGFHPDGATKTQHVGTGLAAMRYRKSLGNRSTDSREDNLPAGRS